MPTLSDDAKRQLDSLLDAYPKDLPGTVVGVVNKEGQLLYLSSTGPRLFGQDAKARPDDVFSIFSCTKMVTGIACMQLVERGLLDLDAPVGQYVEELKDVPVVVDSDETSVRTRPAKTAITARMLLTHTAGYTYSWYNIHIKRWTDQNCDDIFRGQHLKMPLVNEPGSKYEYGIGMDWAGILVERISKQSLGDYCQENLFAPLGLKDCAFDLEGRDDLVDRLMILHQWDTEKNAFTEREFPRGVKGVPFQSGGGGLFITAPEYLQIVATLLNKGKGPNGVVILRPETISTMFENHCADTPDQGGLGTNAKVETADTSKANDALQMLPGVRKGHGLSFLLNLEDMPGGRKAHSAEWGGVANLFWMADPTSEVGMIVFNAVLPYGLPAFYKMEADLQQVVYAPGALVY